jgi:hypothetical protein
MGINDKKHRKMFPASVKNFWESRTSMLLDLLCRGWKFFFRKSASQTVGATRRVLIESTRRVVAAGGCFFIFTICLMAGSWVKIENLSTADYGFHRRNSSVVQDDRGLIYIANGDGVIELDSRFRRLIRLPDGRSASALAKGPDGRIYVGGDGELGFLRATGAGELKYASLLNRLPPENSDFSDRVIKIEVTDLGVIFLTDNWLFIFETKGETKVFHTNDHFFTFLVKDKTLYVLDGEKGLLILNGGRLEPVPGGGLLRSHVIFPYKEKKLLLVTLQEGPVLFDPGNPSAGVSTFPGMHGSFFLDNLITSGLLLGDSWLVLGSIKKGALIMDLEKGKQVHVHKGIGLQGNHVYCLGSDRSGDLWLAMETGVSIISGDFHEVSVPAAKSLRTLIRSCQTSSDDSNFFSGAFYSSGGNIPIDHQPSHQIPMFESSKNAFRFYYASTQFIDMKTAEFSYQLDGGGGAWSKWSRRDYTEYNHLAWGTYTFRVRARNTLEEMAEETTFTFRIGPPWHETWWFLFAQVFFIFLILIISRVVEEAGGSRKHSEFLIFFAVLIVFGYLGDILGPVIGRYSSGIGFFKILLTVIMSLALEPAQNMIKKGLRKLTRLKR